MTPITAIVVAVLGVFTLRRGLLLAAAAAPPRAFARADALPTVTLVVPACNEAAGIDATLAGIARLQYPVERLFVVLVDDRSTDRTAEHLDRWACDRPRTRTLRLDCRVGKPRAVEAGVTVAPPSELVAICDADVRLRPDYLQRVVVAFADETVGGAVGYLAPVNALATPVASYAAVESWIHQLVTSAGKDRLDLNPPTLGGAPVFRRTALESIGWLGPAATGDDVRATVALTRAGWRTRFRVDAVAENAVAADRATYWRQHLRWAHDVYATVGAQRSTAVGVPLRRRIEAWMTSVGYLDRVALLVAVALWAGGRLSLWVPSVYLGVVAIEVVWAVVRAGAGRHVLLVVFRTAVFFPLDVAGSALATASHLLRGRPDGPAPEAPRR